MQLNLTVTSEAAKPALEIDSLKEQLRIDLDDDDPWLTECLAVVTDQLEAYLGLSFIQKTYRWVLDGFGRVRREDDDFWFSDFPRGPKAEIALVLPRSPLVSVSQIQYKDTGNVLQTLSASAYQIDTLRVPARIKPAYGEIWPSTGTDFNAVQITFVAGYGSDHDAVPPRIRHAIRMLVGHLEANREATTAISISEVQLGWRSLVDDYRARHYA